MSNNLTPKQEAFCLRYIETGNASEAYRCAYDAGSMSAEAIRVEACRLLQNPNVSLMVAGLQEEHRERHKVTVGTLTAELEEARDLAKRTEQPAAMVSATLGKAKIHGLTADNAVTVNVTNTLPESDKALLAEYAKAE